MDKFNFSKLKPVSYHRKSSESEDRQVLSINSQQDETQRIANFYKLSEFIENFSESKSAKKEGVRTEFNKMLKLISQQKVDCIVCWKLDRLTRNMTEGGQIIDLLSSEKLKAIITHDKVYYPNDNVLLMSVEFGQGKQFVKELSVNVKRGLRKKAEMGIPSGVATLGFLNDKSEEKGNRKWKVDKLKLEIIKKIFEIFLTGTCSASKLHKYATEVLKLTTVKRKRIGGSPITLSRIYEILKDPIYAGFFFQGGLRYELDSSLPRIITEEQHNKVKAILSNKNIPKIKKNITTFAGFIKSDKNEFIGQDVKYQLICDCKQKFSYLNKNVCPKCNKEIEKLENPKYLSFTYYYNVHKKKNHQKYKTVSENEINKQLCNFFEENLTFSKDLVDWSRKYIVELKDREINERVFQKEKHEAEIKEYEHSKIRLRQMLRDEYITPEEYKNDLKDLENKYLTINNKTDSKWYLEAEQILDITLNLKEIFEKGTIDSKRNILSKLGSNLVWNEEILSIYNSKLVNKLAEAMKGIKLKYPEFEPKNYVINKGEKEKTPLENEVFSTLLGR